MFVYPQVVVDTENPFSSGSTPYYVHVQQVILFFPAR